jgi:hypothetical protein
MQLSRRGATVGAALVALTAMVTLAACSDSSSNGPTRVYLAGNYTVTGVGTSPTTILPVTGTGVLTTTNYTIDIPAIQTLSEGLYQAFSDGTFTQNGTATVNGGAAQPIQCTGTYTDASNVVTVDTICLGQRTVTVLQRN